MVTERPWTEPPSTAFAEVVMIRSEIILIFPFTYRMKRRLVPCTGIYFTKKSSYVTHCYNYSVQYFFYGALFVVW